MLKTIKTTKQMRLDELLKYVWDNGITNTTFKSNYSAIVRINDHGDVSTTNIIHRNDSYTVEVEELIDENTHFNFLIEIDEDNFVHTVEDITISEMICTDTERIYAPVNCKLELVWERDGE